MKKQFIYNLPRGYLSYSAYDLFNKDKQGYIDKYILGKKDFDTVQSRFGREMHKIKEQDNSVQGSETRLECIIDSNLKLLGYLDSLDTDYKVIDFKFSHRDKSGKAPWNKLKVRKHKQFVMYCLLVKNIYGTYNKNCEIHWHETKKESLETKVNGVILGCNSFNMSLTGYVEKIERKVYAYEIKALEKDLIRVAHEITKIYNDYLSYPQNYVA